MANYDAQDRKLEQQAQELLLSFLTSPRVAGLIALADHRLVTDKDENLTRGDVYAQLGGGAIYFEAKAVTHDLTNDPTRFHTRSGRRFPTTIVEVLKERRQDRQWTRDPQQRLADIFGVAREDVAAVDVHPGRRGTVSPYRTLGEVPLGHINLLPYVHGAVAACVDVHERSINFHPGRALLDATWQVMCSRGVYANPGRTDDGTFLVRHVPYGPLAVAQGRDGAWYPMGQATRDWLAGLAGALAPVAA